MAKHTKGPWKRDGRLVYALTDRGVNAWWAGVQTAGRTKDGEASGLEAEEVARLMAAAPDLLDALRAIERLNGSRLDPDLRAAAAAALEKAEG